MTGFVLETWDDGRLVVNHAFANLLRRQHWTTFATIWARTADAAVAKKLRTDRFTLRFTLDDAGRERAFYIKRHGRSSWKEYIKPLLSLRWPILGAKNEWNALLDFHEAGLPTMTPVALGQHGANSFLITEALENCTKLSELRFDEPHLSSPPSSGDSSSVRGHDARMTLSHLHGARLVLDPVPLPHAAERTPHRSPLPTKAWGEGTRQQRHRLIEQVADVARRMHGAGLHHQDFYLGHLLLPNGRTSDRSSDDPIYVIDLGRVRKQVPLASRWIVKDLAQLNYSAHDATATDRLRFLRGYLGRKFCPADRALIARIAAKSVSISRHSRKNSL